MGLVGHGSFEKAGCIYMTNEELASMIQSGERGKVLELWEQVRRFAWQQGKKWAAYFSHAGRPGELEKRGRTLSHLVCHAVKGRIYCVVRAANPARQNGSAANKYVA